MTNIYKKTTKKVGVLRSCDVLRLGIMIFAVWAVLPANGAEAAI